MKTEKKINRIFEDAIRLGASDIHLTNNIRPTLRIDGVLQPIEDLEVNNPDILRQYTKEITNDRQFETYLDEKSLDSSYQYEDTRFRVHIFRQRECDALVLRLIPTDIPAFEDMNLPNVIRKFTTIRNGLILVTGVTGSGKSTTLASLIGEINETQKKHIVTVEDPIEFVHEHKMSMINQREVGTDVDSFADAVKAAMREDPDILLVGELRDLDTISNAITMAETGHLVFGTLHTRSAPETIDRIIDVFPPNQQEQIRMQLANSIGGIVAQDLLPRKGGGRIPSCEIMIPTDAIRNLIRNPKGPNAFLQQIHSNNKDLGSQTRIQALTQLYLANEITQEDATYGLTESEIEQLQSMIITNKPKQGAQSKSGRARRRGR